MVNYVGRVGHLALEVVVVLHLWASKNLIDSVVVHKDLLEQIIDFISIFLVSSLVLSIERASNEWLVFAMFVLPWNTYRALDLSMIQWVIIVLVFASSLLFNILKIKVLSLFLGAFIHH